MRQPADSFVDEELGRDICRFSAIRAMVVPRIVQVGDAYQLDASIVDPMTGRQVEQIRVTADGREEVLLDAIDELSHEVRSRLGESIESIDEADFPIADVTTSSWEAMHYFALGLQEWGRGKFDEAARLFELAVDLDPEFATCRALGHCPTETMALGVVRHLLAGERLGQLGQEPPKAPREVHFVGDVGEALGRAPHRTARKAMEVEACHIQANAVASAAPP